MRRPRSGRLGGYVRAGAGLALAAWLGWYVYVCLTSKPAGVDLAPWLTAGPTPTDDATAEFQSLYFKLSPGRHVPEFGGSLDLEDALRGPWTPQSRPHLRALIEFLELPETVDTVARLHAMTGRPLRDGPFWLNPDMLLMTVRSGLLLMPAHARYALEHRGDVDEWLRSMQTACWLLHELRGILAGMADDMQWPILAEISIAAGESSLPPDVATEIIHTLKEFPSARQKWQEYAREERLTDLARVDCYYSRDARGNGRLLLGARVPDETSMYLRIFEPRSRAWNLASFAYHDRRTVTRRINAYWDNAESALDMPYLAGLRALERIDARTYFGAVDGPVIHSQRQTPPVIYAAQFQRSATVRTVMIVVGLEQFRSRHGGYPPSLDMLSPEFIPELPLDPFCDGPFGYARIDDCNYRLWNCGRNGVDEGGAPVVIDRQKLQSEGVGDHTFSPVTRQPPRKEPAEDATAAAGG